MSSEPMTVHTRPPGEVIAEVYHPPARFGLAMAIAVRAHDGTIWTARHPGESGEGRLVWDATPPGQYYEPLLEFDEEVAKAMLRALNNQPVKSRGDYALDHLTDAIAVRDRLLALVEREWVVRTDTGTRAT